MRLISFLGISNYGETEYIFDGKTHRTRYVAEALAEFLKPSEVRIIATEEARLQHGDELSRAFMEADHPTPEFVPVPTGGEPHQLWKMFGAIVDVIRTSKISVLIDITYGFRMQPFFAAACIQFIQAVVPNPPAIRVVYGEYRGSEQNSPIWELTPFLEVLSWSRNLMMFLRTGQADEVVEPTNSLARELSKQWATAGSQGSQPQLQKLPKALQQFGDDLTTVRTGALLLGTHPSVHRLSTAIELTELEVQQHLPALALVLDQIKSMISPLDGDNRLSSPEGQKRLLALARLYYRMGRYSEAAATIREAWITQHACSSSDCPGISEFNKDHREAAERAWFDSDEHLAKEIADTRNDIQHAGYRRQPLPANSIKEQIEKLIKKFENEIKQR